MPICDMHDPESPLSSSTSTSTPHRPPPLQLPFDPPRRRSSLAFSRILDSPQVRDVRQASMDTTETIERNSDSHSIDSKNRTVSSTLRHSGALPGHVSQIQKVFQLAQANLQLDMHFAASPIGSIDSRLPKTGSIQCAFRSEHKQDENTGGNWRYSMVPKLFSAILSDVREPLPETSPNLPCIGVQYEGDISPPLEPLSSGYTSPTHPDIVSELDEMELPPLPRSSSSSSLCGKVSSSDSIDYIAMLTQPMTGLKVGNDSGDRCEQLSDEMDDSPIVNHLRRKSSALDQSADGMYERLSGISLSQSAKAAAESAKAKRELLKQAFGKLYNAENMDSANHYHRQVSKTTTHASCPDPTLHNYMAITPCPDPLAHTHYPRVEPLSIHPQAHNRNHNALSSINPQQNIATATRQRTTAAGSPMPFIRHPLSPQPALQHPLISPKRSWHLPAAHNTPYTPQHTHKPSEHFRPGWYYSNQSSSKNDGTHRNTNIYSFSTAAAKITGESAAPDSRIRNSYRTDTLTPLARPPGRYRKNGFATALQPPRVHGYHANSRPMPQFRRRWLPPGPHRSRPIQHQNPQFRSSPPPASDRHQPSFRSKKRSYDDSVMPDFNIAEDESATSIDPSTTVSRSDGIIEVDEDTRAAVRMSIFGANTPECLHGSREGIRELSPNVNVWRKDLMSGPYHRKKRRPSYWDGDLEEVRMSPAGRGGIASSPTISKRSMMAELESLSNRTDITAAEGLRLVEGTENFDRLGEVEMADLAELEA